MKDKYSNMGSERNFGIVFFIFFLAIALWPIFSDGIIRIWSLLIALILLIVSIFKPKILEPFNKIWFMFGLLLGSIIAPIVMGIIYFVTITPIGLFMRLIGKDILNRKINKSVKSYWIKRKQMIGTMKNQF